MHITGVISINNDATYEPKNDFVYNRIIRYIRLLYLLNQHFGNLELFTHKNNECLQRIVDTSHWNHVSAVNFGQNNSNLYSIVEIHNQTNRQTNRTDMGRQSNEQTDNN